ncbi:CLUMA_CG003972, isoform A [Clunio marinus]|uniref:CLUMA_CG003972, isoform A n=1 Tax=Clunio marinus TaxID=568069 RepID=A0A1J1HQE0_9DIPT|nr:CLUMA_CG003972, isoform A [Clunio marinus]
MISLEMVNQIQFSRSISAAPIVVVVFCFILTLPFLLSLFSVLNFLCFNYNHKLPLCLLIIRIKFCRKSLFNLFYFASFYSSYFIQSNHFTCFLIFARNRFFKADDFVCKNYNYSGLIMNNKRNLFFLRIFSILIPLHQCKWNLNEGSPNNESLVCNAQK